MSSGFKRILILLILCITACVILAFAEVAHEGQNDHRLQDISKNIKNTEALIQQAKVKKWNILQQVDWLQSKRMYRNELLKGMNLALDKQNHLIQSSESSLEKLKWEIEKIKKAYVHLLKHKLIHRLISNPLLTLLHTEQIDVQVKKWYLIQQSEFNLLIALKQLDSMNSVLHREMGQLTTQYKEQDSLIQASKAEQACLEIELRDFHKLVDSMSTLESGLLAELKMYKQKRESMSSIISGEINHKSKTYNASGPKNMKKLFSYPVHFPTVVSRFGKNMAGGNPNLILRNNGIDIQSSSPFVKSASEGIVVQIRKMPTSDFLVIMRTEDYYLAYSNLESVLLKEGERVTQNVHIGKSMPNALGSFDLHFEIWKGNKPVDPMPFLQ